MCCHYKKLAVAQQPKLKLLTILQLKAQLQIVIQLLQVLILPVQQIVLQLSKTNQTQLHLILQLLLQLLIQLTLILLITRIQLIKYSITMFSLLMVVVLEELSQLW